jgi:hypothetical protein
VNFGERFLSRLPMKVVDILRNHEAQDPERFELRQSEVPRVRLGLGERLVELVGAAAQAFFPGLPGVSHEALELIHGRLAVLGPQAAWTTKRRYTAFDRHPGSGQCDRVARIENYLCGTLNLASGCLSRPFGLHLAPRTSSQRSTCAKKRGNLFDDVGGAR